MATLSGLPLRLPPNPFWRGQPDIRVVTQMADPPRTADLCKSTLKSLGWSVCGSLSRQMGLMVWAVHLHRGQEWRVAYAETELEAWQRAVERAA